MVHGRKLGRGEPAAFTASTLNLRFPHWKPAASGIFAVRVHGLADAAAARRRQPGHPAFAGPDDVNGGRVLLETHCLDWPAGLGAEGGYGKIIRVELLHKLHDELQLRRPRGPDRRHRARTATMRAPFFASTHAEPPPDHARPNLTRLVLRRRLGAPCACPPRSHPPTRTSRLPGSSPAE